MKILNDYIKLASICAEHGTQKRRQKMSAIIIGVPWLSGYNYNIYNRSGKYSIHAEEHVLLKAARAGIPLLGKTMLVYRANGNGLSKPCARCIEIMKKAGISKVAYSDGDRYIIRRIERI